MFLNILIFISISSLFRITKNITTEIFEILHKKNKQNTFSFKPCKCNFWLILDSVKNIMNTFSVLKINTND